MSAFASTTELKKHSLAELEKERKGLLQQAAHMRIALRLKKEKNHAAYRALRKHIARVTMVLDMMKKGLRKEKSDTTMTPLKGDAKSAKKSSNSSQSLSSSKSSS